MKFTGIYIVKNHVIRSAAHIARTTAGYIYDLDFKAILKIVHFKFVRVNGGKHIYIVRG